MWWVFGLGLVAGLQILGVFTYLIPCEGMVASAFSSLGTHAPCVVQTFRDPYSHSSGCPRWLQSGMDDWGNSKMCPLDKWDFAHPQIIATNKNFLFYDIHYFYLCLGTSHPLEMVRITENNVQLFVCNEIISLGAIFDSAVFSMKWPQAQFSCC